MLKLTCRAGGWTFWLRCSTNLKQTRTFHATAILKDAKPIYLDEFQRHYQRCVPAQYQESKLAVAFSGGPDSTCLLYLLRQLIDSNANEGHKPSDIVAITIDHGLQAASGQMTAQCVVIAESLKVKHLVLMIPWGIDPFPSVPSSGSSFENIARGARYHLFLSALKKEGISTIAFGHHADDQVETALLRITRGSTEVGVAGMKPRRLWGMGFGFGPKDLGWAGQHGMSRWIIRPLLRLPKERLIATCRDASLEYVVDKTNFQPDIALRNRIRHQLDNDNASSQAVIGKGTMALLDMAARVAVTGERTERTPRSGREDHPGSLLAKLRPSVESISSFVEDLNYKASIELAKCLRPSPVSTILLSKDSFSRVTDKPVRLEIIRRVLRFVSPFPWGSPRAEAGRRMASLQKISDALTMSGDSPRMVGQGKDPLAKFVAGGGVIWSPIRISQNAEVKNWGKGCSVSDERGWLASRQPPIQRFRDSTANSLELDITASVLSALSQDTSVEILYDNRFLLHITPRLFPANIHYVIEQITAERGEMLADQALVRFLVIPHTRYFLPKVILRRTDTEAELFNSGDDHRRWQGLANARKDEHEIARLSPDGSTRTPSSIGENNKSGTHPACNGEAVRINYIRILDTDSANEYPSQLTM